MRSVKLNDFCAVLIVLIIIGWLIFNCINILYLVGRSRGGLRFFEVYWFICLMSLGVEGEFYKKASEEDRLLMCHAFKIFKVSSLSVVVFLFFFIGAFS